jgi:hypothetical protein
MRKKHRNLETEKYVAKKQINAIGGGLELEDLLKIIDAKDGDYYKAELNPREGWKEAYDHFGMTGKRETLDLQKEIVEEMKQYYGLNGNTARTPTPAALPTEVKEKYVNDILGYDVQAKYEDIIKPRGIIFKNMHPLEEAALFSAAALAAGGTGAAVLSGNDQKITEEELKAMQKENPNLLVNYV